MNYFLLCSFWLFGVFGPCAIAQTQQGLKKAPGTAGVPSGAKLLQVISDPVTNLHFFYWVESKKHLYATELVTDKLHIWDFKTSKITTITPMAGEPLAFFIPFKNSDKKAIIGSRKSLRIFEGTEKNFKVSDPVLKIEEDGYFMYRAQCDSNGVLYILAQYLLADDSKAKGSILYVVKNKKLQQVKKFDSVVFDFTFSKNNKNMYVITNRGKNIMKYNLDANKGELSGEKPFFTVDSVETLIPFRAKSITFDSQNNLYAVIGLEVVRLDGGGKLTETIRMPFIGIELIFGGYKHQNLLVGTTKLPLPFKDKLAGAILAISGFAGPGQLKYPVNW